MFIIKKILLLIIFIVLILALASCSLGLESDFYECYQLTIKPQSGVWGDVYVDGDYSGMIGGGWDMIVITCMHKGDHTISLYHGNTLYKTYYIYIYSDKTFYCY